MTYSKEQQQEHMSQIRRVLVIKPESTIREIKETLGEQKKPLNLDKDYINRLVNKIRGERARRLDFYTINKILVDFQDEVAELKKRLWIIITDPTSLEKDKIAAIRELRTSSKELFDKMFDAGVFKRKLGELEFGKELNQEEQNLIKKAINLDYGDKPKPKSEPKPAGGDDPGKPSTTGGEDKPE